MEHSFGLNSCGGGGGGGGVEIGENSVIVERVQDYSDNSNNDQSLNGTLDPNKMKKKLMRVCD